MGGITSIESLDEEIRLRCPDAYGPNVLMRAKAAAREFAMRTAIWRQTITITSVADQASYTLTPTTGTEIHRLIRVCPLTSTGEEQEETPEGGYYFDLSDGKIYFEDEQIPAEAGVSITVEAALRPEWDAASATFPAWILSRWGTGIAAGAAAEIMRRPPLSYPANDSRLSEALLEFSEAIADAKSEVIRRGTARHVGYSPA